MATTHTIDADVFRRFALDVFGRVGVPAAHADDAVESLTWASLRGVDTHGVRNLKSYYVDPVAAGEIHKHPDFSIEYETTMSARTNGDGGLGLAAAAWGMRLAIDKAAGVGLGLVSMRNTNHLGAAGYLAHMAVQENMIGVCLSGKMYAEGNPTGMPPVFSLQPMFGTNPLSVAIPCGDEPPFVLDMSSTVVPVNRVELMREKGESIPAGWCLDGEGKPTTDPAEAKIVLPLGGTREQGAHKGFGLALVVEVLTALLSEGWAKKPEPANNTSSRFSQDSIAHFFGAMRVDLFRDPDDFKTGMDAMVAAIHRAPVAPGYERVIVPGEMEHETEAIRRRDGIPLRESEVRDLRALAERYDVPLELVGGSL